MMRGKLDYLGDVLDVFAQIANGQGQGELERGEVDQFHYFTLNTSNHWTGKEMGFGTCAITGLRGNLVQLWAIIDK